MSSENSAVLEFGAPEPGETASMMRDKLRFHTDSWDLSIAAVVPAARPLPR